MSVLPLATFSSPGVPYFGSGGGGGQDLNVNSVTASQYVKSQSFFTSTIGALSLPANSSTIVLAMPNDTRYSGLWSVNAGISEGGTAPKANGALFTVAGFNTNGNNVFAADTIASKSNGYPITIFTSGQNNVPPTIYISNPTNNAQVATVAFHQMG